MKNSSRLFRQQRRNASANGASQHSSGEIYQESEKEFTDASRALAATGSKYAPDTVEENDAKPENGFSLIEMMLVLTVVTVLACIALPNPVTVNRILLEKAARAQVARMFQVISTAVLCHQQAAMESAQGEAPVPCGPVDALIPNSGAVTAIGGYNFTFVGFAPDGSWSYTGTPQAAGAGLRTVSVGQTGAMSCDSSPCYAALRGPDVYLVVRPPWLTKVEPTMTDRRREAGRV